MRDWQSVYRDQFEYRAEIVKAVLDDHDMNPVLLNKKDSAYQLGHFEILVAPDHVIKAIKLINDEIQFE
ncbi:hypothetical protein [Marinoscillum sp.]|uniref:hypothetical protein n=1 Tax=Marinoscillum sp. TaxID=2024838 RepID=UPI003BA853DC